MDFKGWQKIYKKERKTTRKAALELLASDTNFV